MIAGRPWLILNWSMDSKCNLMTPGLYMSSTFFQSMIYWSINDLFKSKVRNGPDYGHIRVESGDFLTIICNHFQKFRKFKDSSLFWWPKIIALKNDLYVISMDECLQDSKFFSECRCISNKNPFQTLTLKSFSLHNDTSYTLNITQSVTFSISALSPEGAYQIFLHF